MDSAVAELARPESCPSKAEPPLISFDRDGQPGIQTPSGRCAGRRARDLSSIRAARVCSSRTPASIPVQLSAGGMVPAAPFLGRAHSRIPRARARLARENRCRRYRAGRHLAQGHRRTRHQHYYGPRHSEPRRSAYEPPRLFAKRRKAANLWNRLRRRRRRNGARSPHGARKPGQQRALHDGRPVQPVRPPQRSEHGHVRLRRAVWRWSRWRRSAQLFGRCATARGSRKSSHSASTCGATRVTSWVGISRMMALVSSSVLNCRRSCAITWGPSSKTSSTGTR